MNILKTPNLATLRDVAPQRSNRRTGTALVGGVLLCGVLTAGCAGATGGEVPVSPPSSSSTDYKHSQDQLECSGGDVSKLTDTGRKTYGEEKIFRIDKIEDDSCAVLYQHPATNLDANQDSFSKLGATLAVGDEVLDPCAWGGNSYRISISTSRQAASGLTREYVGSLEATEEVRDQLSACPPYYDTTGSIRDLP